MKMTPFTGAELQEMRILQSEESVLAYDTKRLQKTESSITPTPYTADELNDMRVIVTDERKAEYSEKLELQKTEKMSPA